MPRYVTAKEAAEALNISLPTLYAYVSRGLIRSEAAEDPNSRQRRYNVEDIDRLLAKKEAAHSPEKIAETALHWGTPLLESAITLIRDGRLYYRGLDAAGLVENYRYEEVVALVWTGEIDETLFTAKGAQVDVTAVIPDTLPDIARMQIALAAADDLNAYDLRASAVIQTGVRIIRLLTQAAGGNLDDSQSIAEALAAGWGLTNPKAARLIDMALILCADHELNASSFAARVAASAGATPYAVVIAGLAALSGVKHGGQSERVSALLRELQAAPNARTLIAERLRRGEIIPGFGHRLYPDGDPRAAKLLDAANAYSAVDKSAAPFFALVAELLDAMYQMGEYPNLDLALATLEHLLHLKYGAALTLFALGRTAGWIGHAIEQYEDGRLLRPRARYVGVEPD